MENNFSEKRRTPNSWIAKSAQLSRLGELLVKRKYINENEKNRALEYSKDKKIRFGSALNDLNILSEKDILICMGSEIDVPVIHSLIDQRYLAKLGVDYQFFTFFPSDVLERKKIIPLRVEQSNELGNIIFKVFFVFSDPLQYSDMETLMLGYCQQTLAKDKLSHLSGYSQNMSDSIPDIEYWPYLATEESIENGLNELAGKAAGVRDVFSTGEEMAGKQLQDILNAAVHANATDIHLSQLHMNGGLWVRFRVDGEMEDYIRNGRLTPEEYNMILNKGMDLFGLNRAKKQVPQDGSTIIPVDRIQYEMRISSTPTSLVSDPDNRGCKLQVRILYKSAVLDLDSLGLSPFDKETLRHIYTRPEGLTFVAGPTSSGKSTTTYSMLKRQDMEKQVVLTVEDPVEYSLEGAYQIPVSSIEGRGFNEVLRSAMRQDPDIIFIGEIRDRESASAALQFAHTGHSVFTTIHTNTAYDIPQRLLSMGIEPHLILGAVNGAISQRLVKANCPHCLVEYEPSEKVCNLLGLKPGVKYLKGSGILNGQVCPHCKGKGFLGRLAIFEIAPFCKYDGWEDIMGSPADLKKFFNEKGHPSLMEDARAKMISGKIAPDALAKVLARQESV